MYMELSLFSTYPLLSAYLTYRRLRLTTSMFVPQPHIYMYGPWVTTLVRFHCTRVVFPLAINHPVNVILCGMPNRISVCVCVCVCVFVFVFLV